MLLLSALFFLSSMVSMAAADFVPGVSGSEIFNPLPKIYSNAAMQWGRKVGLLQGSGEWPKFTTQATYEPYLNETELDWVGHCLAQWCDTNTFLKPRYGRIACRTSDDKAGGGSMGFICNRGGKARCSRVQIAKVLHTLYRETGSQTGYINLQTGPMVHMTIGFDTYCEGTKCGEARNPLWAACENPEARHREPMQLDKEISEEDIYGMQVKKEYKGISWVNQPTPTATGGSLEYPRVTGAAGGNP
jgi:hypothetical protein